MRISLFKGLSAVLLGALLFGLSQSPLHALQVTGLYSHRVAVSNESDAERNRAFREALQAVLLKVTGERRWLDHPVLERAIQNAQSYVEAISYSSETVTLEPDPETEPGTDDVDSIIPPTPRTVEQRYIDVDFAATLIDQLLQGADVPIWDSNRPSVLVWMALQNANGDRTMLSADSDPRIISYMQEFADERGLPIMFPILDFEDRRALNEDAVWALDAEAIAAASERYGADSVLAGRVHFTASGELVGLWQFIFQDSAEVFDGFSEGLEPYLFAPLDRVTNQLASYFAILPEASAQQTVRLRVEGVRDLRAYSALLTYVSNLGLVESVSPAALDGERLDLHLDLVGNAEQLYELIALDRDLLPIQSSRGDPDTMLHYRWTR